MSKRTYIENQVSVYAQSSSDDGGKVCIRPKYKPYAVKSEGLFLVSDQNNQIFEGQIYADLLPLLTGRFGEREIADKLEPLHSRQIVHYAIGVLVERNVVIRSTGGKITNKAAFWDELDLNSEAAEKRLLETTVAVTRIGDVKVKPVAQALKSVGMPVQIVGKPTNEKLHVVVTDDYLSPELAEISSINLLAKRPWLLVLMTGVELWIGPFFQEGLGCWECLATRIKTNRALETYLTRRLKDKGNLTKTTAYIPPLNLLAAGHVALEVIKFSVGYLVEPLHVKTLDLRTMQTTIHPFERRPQCPRCGNRELQSDSMTKPVQITDDEVPPWETFEDIHPYVSKVTGIVTALVPMNTGMSSLYFYTGFFGFGRDAVDFESLKNSMLSQASGVGTTEEAAKIGAICEAIERYSGMYEGDEPTIRATFNELDPSTRLHPNLCMLYSELQFKNRDSINANGTAFTYVPSPLDETAFMDWTGIWSISENRFKLIPSGYLFYYYPQTTKDLFCWADSNGCAAGKTLTDAIRRGLFELTERDSVAIWWYNRLQRPGVDLASFHYDYFDEFLKNYAGLQRDAWVIDITTDLGIPSFVAISRRLGGKTEDILISFGSHLDPRIAIERALCEMNHLLPAVLPMNRDSSGDYPYPDPAQKSWWRTATIESESYLLPDPDIAHRTADHYNSSIPESIAEQVNLVCSILNQCGLEVLVANQTRPDIKVPVAKVIVPGLRHFWTRFGPGRLYNVPVKLGWLEKPRLEHELNPIAMFL